MGKSDTDVGVNNRETRRIVTRGASTISSSRKHPVVSKNVLQTIIVMSVINLGVHSCQSDRVTVLIFSIVT